MSIFKHLFRLGFFVFLWSNFISTTFTGSQDTTENEIKTFFEKFSAIFHKKGFHPDLIKLTTEAVENGVADLIMKNLPTNGFSTLNNDEVSDALEFLLDYFDESLRIENEFDDVLQKRNVLEQNSKLLETEKVLIQNLTRDAEQLLLESQIPELECRDWSEAFPEFFSSKIEMEEKWKQIETLQEKIVQILMQITYVHQDSVAFTNKSDKMVTNRKTFIIGTTVTIYTQKEKDALVQAYEDKPKDFSLEVMKSLLKLLQKQKALINNFGWYTEADVDASFWEKIMDLAYLTVSIKDFFDDFDKEISIFLIRFSEPGRSIANKHFDVIDLIKNMHTQTTEYKNLLKMKDVFDKTIDKAAQFCLMKIDEFTLF